MTQTHSSREPTKTSRGTSYQVVGMVVYLCSCVVVASAVCCHNMYFISCRNVRKWEPNVEYLKQFVAIQPGGREPLIMPEAVKPDQEFRHGKVLFIKLIPELQ